MVPSDRSNIEPFRVMDVMTAAAAREAEGHRVLHLEVGQPSTPAPRGVLAAARRALRDDNLGYTSALGIPELRERIAGWYRQRYGVRVLPGQVVVTTGASGSCVLAFHALWDTGARVGVFEPGYPAYRNDLQAFGCHPIPIPLSAETGFRPTTALLDAAGPLDGLVVASPSNPTGTVMNHSDLASVLGWAKRRDVPVVMDEIYHGISYDGKSAPTALAHSDEVVVFNSFSKYFSMTGWRLGWIVAPEGLVPALERLAQNLTISAPTLSQLAGLAAFDCVEECEANVARYAKNRFALKDALTTAGITKVAPADGAFYLWADITDLGLEAGVLTETWLNEISVAATPGFDFDPARGKNFVRLSYAGSEADVIEAGFRLVSWCRGRT